jgi:hypothetical protein
MTIQCSGCKRLINMDVDKFLRIQGLLFHNKACNIMFNTQPRNRIVSKKQQHHLNWRGRG